MSEATNEALFGRWKDEPAPLLPLLHEFHERDGYLSEPALRAISKELRIPIADLFGMVTFYHHFARDEGGLERPRVCNGAVCQMRGADKLLEEFRQAGLNPETMPCPGRCDEPVPVLRGNTVWVGGSMDSWDKPETVMPMIDRFAEVIPQLKP